MRDGPDIVGIGALNVDYIATASRLSRRVAEQITESTSRFEWSTEGAVDEETIGRAFAHLGSASLATSLGGSAWNTIFALACLEQNLRLGYIGVLGRLEAPGLSFVRQMDELGVDHRMVARRPHRPGGLCLSFIEDTERVLLTHPGANLEMADYISGNLEELAVYVASARLVHLTSFLDERTPIELQRLLSRARELNPRLIVSFDPGHDWTVHLSRSIASILQGTDLLFVNYREFKALARYAHGETDEVLGERVILQCRSSTVVFVTKRYDLVEVFSRQGGRVKIKKYTHNFFDSDRDIEDATGAGDVFAAAALSTRASRSLQVQVGASLGLRLARHKLRHRAATGHSSFPDLRKGLLEPDRPVEAPAGSAEASVVVAHDGGSEWDVVESFLQQTFGVATRTLTPMTGGVFPETLETRRAFSEGYAVCILRRASREAGKDARPDDTIVQYVGFLQGRYGFSRVAVLVEDGCSTFSNVAGLIRLTFAPGHVEHAFVDLERMLRREGLSGPGRNLS